MKKVKKLSREIVSAIRQHIIDGRSEEFITMKYNISATTLDRINRGVTYDDVRPFTNVHVTKSEPIVVIKPEFPKQIILTIPNEEFNAWLLEKMKEKREETEIKLSKVKLMLYALKTNDFSDLPPSCLVELREQHGVFVENNKLVKGETA